MSMPGIITVTTRTAAGWNTICATLCNGQRLRVERLGRTADHSRRTAQKAILKQIADITAPQPEEQTDDSSRA